MKLSQEAIEKIADIIKAEFEPEKPVPVGRQPVGKRMKPDEFVPDSIRLVLIRRGTPSVGRYIAGSWYTVWLNITADYCSERLDEKIDTWEELPE